MSEIPKDDASDSTLPVDATTGDAPVQSAAVSPTNAATPASGAFGECEPAEDHGPRDNEFRGAACFQAERCRYCGNRQGFVLGLFGFGLRQRGHEARCCRRQSQNQQPQQDAKAQSDEADEPSQDGGRLTGVTATTSAFLTALENLPEDYENAEGRPSRLARSSRGSSRPLPSMSFDDVPRVPLATLVSESNDLSQNSQALTGKAGFSDEPNEACAAVVSAAVSESASAPVVTHKLCITFVRAIGLKSVNVVKDAPWCLCKVVPVQGKHSLASCWTRAATDALNPQWDEKLVLEPWHVGESLEFSIHHLGLFGSKTRGKVIVPSENFYPNGFDGEVPFDSPHHFSVTVRISLVNDEAKADGAAIVAGCSSAATEAIADTTGSGFLHELIVELGDDDEIGLIWAPEFAVLLMVLTGTPAAKAGAARFVGRRCTHINGLVVENAQDLAATCQPCSCLRLRFGAAEAWPATLPHAHRDLLRGGADLHGISLASFESYCIGAEANMAKFQSHAICKCIAEKLDKLDLSSEMREIVANFRIGSKNGTKSLADPEIAAAKPAWNMQPSVGTWLAFRVTDTSTPPTTSDDEDDDDEQPEIGVGIDEARSHDLSGPRLSGDSAQSDRCRWCGKREGYFFGLRGLGWRKSRHEKRCERRSRESNGAAKCATAALVKTESASSMLADTIATAMANSIASSASSVVGLSPEELREARLVFELCDVDSSQTLSMQEFTTVCLKYPHVAAFVGFGPEELCCSKKDFADALFRDVDTGKSAVSWKEFTAFVAKKRSTNPSGLEASVTSLGRQSMPPLLDTNEQIDLVFQMCDVDKSGTISMIELVAFCVKHPQAAIVLGLLRTEDDDTAEQSRNRRREYERLFYEIDTDGSRSITLEELRAFVKTLKPADPLL